MRKESVRIAVIGAGHIAQVVHIPFLSKSTSAELVAVCDLNAQKARWVAEKFNIPQHIVDPETLFKSDEIDAIDLCTPTDSHRDLAVSALSAGKHVLVEKPMARTAAEAREMVEAADRYRRTLMVGMNVRFRRDAITLKSFVDGNEFGRVHYIKSGWMKQRNLAGAKNSWHFDRQASGGGVLMDLGIQILDLGWWILGSAKPVTVKAVVFNRTPDLRVEDSAVCLLEFDNGSIVSFESSWALLSERDEFYFTLYGSNATATLNPLRVFKKMHGNLVNIIPQKDENSTFRYKRSYSNELKHFVDCLLLDTPPLSSARESADRLQVLEAFYESAESGKEVRLS